MSDWSTRGQYDWHTPEGIAQLQERLRPKLPWEPNIDLQLKPLAKLLMGKHGLVISATGDGKLAIFYTYSLMRPDTMTIVIAPTNALEDDMNSLQSEHLRRSTQLRGSRLCYPCKRGSSSNG
ncbi:hypothetical protein BC835DRAFT_1311329 [Cytidiella melzeri]|nr:hypothetical protein BC835DRAFT_1311329 [Cytidiella melzeri]